MEKNKVKDASVTDKNMEKISKKRKKTIKNYAAVFAAAVIVSVLCIMAVRWLAVPAEPYVFSSSCDHISVGRKVGTSELVNSFQLADSAAGGQSARPCVTVTKYDKEMNVVEYLESRPDKNGVYETTCRWSRKDTKTDFLWYDKIPEAEVIGSFKRSDGKTDMYIGFDGSFRGDAYYYETGVGDVRDLKEELSGFYRKAGRRTVAFDGEKINCNRYKLFFYKNKTGELGAAGKEKAGNVFVSEDGKWLFYEDQRYERQQEAAA